MTAFALLATALVFLALLWLVPPLLRPPRPRPEQLLDPLQRRLRELQQQHRRGALGDDEYRRQRLALAEGLLEQLDTPATAPVARAPWVGALVALLVPVLALGLYLKLGNPSLLAGRTAHTAAGEPHPGGKLPPVEEMVAKLEAHLQEQPDDPQGWYLLGRSYLSMQQYDKAARALRRVLKLEGESAKVLMQLADALAMQQNGRIQGESARLVKRALELDPDLAEARWMAGIAAEQAGQYEVAIRHWQHALQGMEDAQSRQILTQAITRAAQKLGQDPARFLAGTGAAGSKPAAEAASAAPAQSGGQAAGGPARITVQVSLADQLAGAVSPDDTVFVFAKAPSGPPMPLAAAKLKVRDLPATVTLDDSQAMLPNLKLSGFEQVVVSARVSRSGSPMPQAGDLASASQTLQPARQPTARLRIDHRL